MLHIAVGDIYCTLIDAKYNLNALAVIRMVCRAKPSGFQFMPKYKAGQWDGYISLMPSFASFPTGLLSDVEATLKELGYTFELVKASNGIIIHDDVTSTTLHGIELRDYQVRAANMLLTKTRGVAKMATNSGKTEVMAAVIKVLNSKTIVLVHRKELMYQTAERFTKRGIDNVGMIGDGIWQPNKVTVAMIQTLSGNMAKLQLDDNVVLFIDECHHLSSKQASDLFNSIPGMYRFGVSGTPLRKDDLADLKLMASTGPVIYELTNEYLIDHGFSARPRILLHTIESLADDDWEMDYHDAYKKLVVDNVERNKFIADYAKAANGVVLILVNMLEHGRNIQALSGGKFVSGSDSTEYRKSVIDEMRIGSGIFIATPIFDEGVDIPGVNVVIIAGCGNSQVKLLQRIGRGLRRKDDGVNELIVVDFIDDTNKSLLSQSNVRIDTYVDEGFDTGII
jgi:superfamily II DNA or RNA helicase